MADKVFSVFAEDLARVQGEKDAALVQVNNLLREKQQLVADAKKNAADAQAADENLWAEKVAHLDTRAKLGSLQDRVGRIPELERKYAQAVSELDTARSDLVQAKLAAAALEEELGGMRDGWQISEARRKQAEEELSIYKKLAKGIKELRGNWGVIAAEAERLGG